MKLNKALLLLFITVGFSLFTAPAKTQNVDSLYSLWQDQTQPDSIRVAAYKDYIRNAYLFARPDSAAVLADALHRYAQRHNYPKAAATGYSLQGIAYHFLGNYPRALEYYQKSLTIQVELRNKKGTALVLNNIGNIYFTQDNYPRALEYYEKSLAIREEIGEKQGIAATLNNIGGIYNNQSDYPRSMEYYQKSLAIKEDIGDYQGVANSQYNIGNVYHKQGDYPRALEYYEKSLAMGEEIGDKRIIISNLTNIGFVYTSLGKTSRALENCQKSLDLAKEFGALEEQEGACNCLYYTYKEMGRGNEALVYLEKMNEIADSLHTQETAKKLEQMEFAKVMLQDSIAKAEEARLVQEAHREEVRQKNQTRNALLGSTLLFILLAAGLYSRWRYVRKSRDIISKEKDRSENLLLNILPAEIARELKENGRAQARDFEMVSILFTDFKSFTETSARLSAAELVMEINACFEAFDVICDRYHIEKIKTIGDAYMAAGGLPVPTDDAVKNTVLAALEMQAFIAKRKAESDAAGKRAFEMRVGIHTGPVVAGIVGVKKFQYDIWGDTVNTASRMESNGQVGKVNISESTYMLLKDDPDFAFENRGMIEAKGKGEIEMYFVHLKTEKV